MNLILIALLLTLTATPSVQSYAADIQLHKGKQLNVTYKGKPLIVGESVGAVGEPGVAGLGYGEMVRDGTVAINVYRIGDLGVDFRREAVLASDGVLELTVRAEYKLLKPVEPRYLLYSFAIPVEYFNGCSWKMRCGMEGGYNCYEGQFGGSIADGAVFAQQYIRYLALEKAGFNLVIDFNPYGSGTFAPYTGAGDPAEMAYSIVKQGDRVVFSFFKRDQPEFFGAKVQLYSGRYNYEERHPFTTWDYISGPSDKRPVIYSFSHDQPALNVKDFGLSDYRKETGHGWLSRAMTLKPFGQTTENIFRQGVLAAAGGKAELLLDAHPGVYLFTATCGHLDLPIGPFTIKVNNEIAAENVKVKAGYVRQIDASIYLRAPRKQLKLSISGKNAWAINNFTFQPYIYQNEDYAIDRGYWFDDKLPELMPGNNNPPKKINRTVLSSNLLPEMKLETGYLAAGHEYIPEVMPPDNSPATDWKWNMRMVEFNGETALNRQDKSVMRQRLIDEVKNAGVNTLDEQSLFWYNSHRERWAAHQQIQKEITETAHELGIKVVRHMDAPVVLKRGSGPRFLVEHIGLLNRDTVTSLPTMSTFCINNPKYRRMFFDQLIKYVTDTRVDGVMIDETYFRPINYCGCIYCRKKFEADTGCRLPFDSASHVILNQQDPIWLRWISWRYQAEGDFFVALRKRLNTVRPEVVVMGYDNEIDLMDGARVDISMAERELARGCDMVGTEGVISNIYAHYRTHYMCRKITSAINASYNRAGWGLFALNPGNSDLLFTTWAMQQMNGQSEWSSGIFNNKSNTDKYLWPDYMSSKDTESMADIAILYTADLRYTDRTDPLKPLNFCDLAGFSQAMTDAHIPHVFVVKHDLQPEKLKKYKALILASAESLSQQELSAIKEYVKNGGTLIVSGAVATVDNNYLSYQTDHLSQVTGVTNWSPKPEITGSLTITLDNTTATLAGKAWKITPAPGTQTIATVLSDDQMVSPAIIVNNFGKGTCITSALPLGKFNCEPMYYTGQQWTYQKNTNLAELLVKLIDRASNAKYPIQTINIPEGVIIEPYKSTKTGTIYIHLLNMTAPGKQEIGKPVISGSEAKPVFPRLESDLIFEIPGTYTTAYATSPDFQGHREIKLTTTGTGSTRITVNPTELIRYTLLILTPK